MIFRDFPDTQTIAEEVTDWPVFPHPPGPEALALA